METNKQLRNEIKELKDIVSGLLAGWKSKHPGDFEMPKGYTLMGADKDGGKNLEMPTKEQKIKMVRKIKTKSGRSFKFETEIDPNLKISEGANKGCGISYGH